jgi:membrane protein DedA with SNARE-associated domain
MGDFFTQVFEWMAALSPMWAYTAILIIAYGENVAPPIPGDMVVVFGGYLVGLGKLNFAMVVLLSTLGGALGFMTMYAIGYRIGEAVLDPERLRWLPKDRIEKARVWVRRWGYGVVAANRFLSGLRSVISLTVGMSHMNPWKTAAYATLSAAVWTTLIAFLGYQVGENWEVVRAYLQVYGWVIGGLIVLFIAVQVYLAYRRRKRWRAAHEAADREA